MSTENLPALQDEVWRGAARVGGTVRATAITSVDDGSAYQCWVWMDRWRELDEDVAQVVLAAFVDLRWRLTQPGTDRLLWRHVGTPCSACLGSGVRCYGSTATWRGGQGAARSTHDVCDTCWGSGDSYRHWTDLRRQHRDAAHRIAAEAARLFAARCGASLSVMRAAVSAVADELDRLARKYERQRSAPKDAPAGVALCCATLAQVLREAAQATEPDAHQEGSPS